MTSDSNRYELSPPEHRDPDQPTLTVQAREWVSDG